MKSISLLVVVVLLSCHLAAAELYKVINQDGTVTYTDTPQHGAVKLELGKTNSVVMPALTPATNAAKPKATIKQAPNYQLTLLTPEQQATVRDNRGRMSVRAQLSPAASGQFELYLDGDLLQTSSVPTFQLENVLRGQHKVQVKFVNNTGKILASSDAHVFYMHQNSILINPN